MYALIYISSSKYMTDISADGSFATNRRGVSTNGKDFINISCCLLCVFLVY